MFKRLLPIACMLAALPAWAEEARPRLVAGGMNLAQQDFRVELYAAKSGFSAGAASDQASAERGRMALGGYAAYAFQDLKLSSSFKGGSDLSVADFSAAYTGFGADSIAAFRLGYEWGTTQAFSVNPAQAGLSAFSGAYDPNRSVGDLSMTLSFTHDVTPSFSLGGFAAASRKDDERSAPENSLRVGAGLGYRF
ncbi:MAG: hypothetical protein ACM3Q1_12620 [Bacteroidales bacterium]